MLSYQHIYHAGNLADVHKHACLCQALHYLTQKDKSLHYIETHAGRGLYDLTAAEAVKTGEADAGIAKVIQENWFQPDHLYMQTIDKVKKQHGENAYPGSPLIAEQFLRHGDQMSLAELHPREYDALCEAISFDDITIYEQDGFDFILSNIPKPPARGFLLIDPSYEMKSEYDIIPDKIQKIHKKWPVGVIMLWYPILNDDRHLQMTKALEAAQYKGFLKSEVRFRAIAKEHRLCGSGIILINTPYTVDQDIAEIEAVFAACAI